MMEQEKNLGTGVNSEHHNHESEKKEAFLKQHKIMGKIYAIGFGEYAKEVPNFEDAFDLNKHILEKSPEVKKCVCCMDERTPFGIHVAGSGILLTDEKLDEYIKENNPDAISSHDGCGAGKIYCQLHGLPEDKSDEIARGWAQETAKKYDKKHIHLGYNDMVGSPDFHHARVCYIDATGSFNYRRKDDLLPAGFVVNKKGIGLENALAENKVAITIMFDRHGLKEYFTPENPFLIVIIAEDQAELEELKKELDNAISNDPLIKIDGFIK
jgi:hypothetical protein